MYSAMLLLSLMCFCLIPVVLPQHAKSLQKQTMSSSSCEHGEGLKSQLFGRVLYLYDSNIVSQWSAIITCLLPVTIFKAENISHSQSSEKNNMFIRSHFSEQIRQSPVSCIRVSLARKSVSMSFWHPNWMVPMEVVILTLCAKRPDVLIFFCKSICRKMQDKVLPQ